MNYYYSFNIFYTYVYTTKAAKAAPSPTTIGPTVIIGAAAALLGVATLTDVFEPVALLPVALGLSTSPPPP
jgi:hypothetical protein